MQLRSGGELLLRLLFAVALGASLLGCVAVSCEPPEPRATLALERSSSSWPRVLGPELEDTRPATEVVVQVDRIEVRNERLVSTWPAAALARAEAAAEEPGWPRIAEVVSEGELRAALLRARRAERSATGAGTGAGELNLRIASDVLFERVASVLLATARVGYRRPRILVGNEGQKMFAWPSAEPAMDPSREAIEAALRGEATLVAPSAGTRVRLTNERFIVDGLGGTDCTIEGELGRERLERCAAELSRSSVRLVLEVAPDVRFERVSDAVQVLGTNSLELRVVARRF